MIDKLEFLIALAHEKHFGRAAEACGVTQPTLSAGIKQLEETLGVMLVRRGSRFLGLTVEGDRVLEWARRIVADSRALKQDVDALKRGLSGHLRIAAIPTALPIVAALTTPFHKRYPAVRYTVISRSSQEILELLGNLEIDVGLTYLDNEPLGRVSIVPLYTERYCLLINRDAALAAKKTVTWAEVAKIPLCLLTPDMQNRRIIDRNLQIAGATASATLESNSMIVLFAHIQTGQWATIMPEKLTRSFSLADKVNVIPIGAPDTAYTIGLIAGPREPLTPLVTAIMLEARRAASSLGDLAG
ncbi:MULTISPECIES: LysR family transcriptional regulator [Rhodomicrobium]|uniref:LysR family transcriptional regulator n=1 Tax=Rhodomicrobium TaxID=1068 RepID=UPI000B4C1E10|nr:MULTISPECIES: LysR family transcriptional regulator [Rhodomicrobium]